MDLFEVNDNNSGQLEAGSSANLMGFGNNRISDERYKQILADKLIEMNTAEKGFKSALRVFSEKKKEFARLKQNDEKNEELFLLTRVIKKEVIDLADTMDVLAEVVSRQDHSIANIQNILVSLVKKEDGSQFKRMNS